MTHLTPRYPGADSLASSPRPEAPAGGPVIPLPARPPRGSECDEACAFCHADHPLHAEAVAWMDSLFGEPA